MKINLMVGCSALALAIFAGSVVADETAATPTAQDKRHDVVLEEAAKKIVGEQQRRTRRLQDLEDELKATELMKQIVERRVKCARLGARCELDKFELKIPEETAGVEISSGGEAGITDGDRALPQVQALYDKEATVKMSDGSVIVVKKGDELRGGFKVTKIGTHALVLQRGKKRYRVPVRWGRDAPTARTTDKKQASTGPGSPTWSVTPDAGPGQPPVQFMQPGQQGR